MPLSTCQERQVPIKSSVKRPCVSEGDIVFCRNILFLELHFEVGEKERGYRQKSHGLRVCHPFGTSFALMTNVAGCLCSSVVAREMSEIRAFPRVLENALPRVV